MKKQLKKKKNLLKKKILFNDIYYEDLNNVESIEFPIDKLFTEKEIQEFKNIEKKELIEILKNRILEKISEL